MKMAKASEADIKMAMDLSSALDSLTTRWAATMPEAIEQIEGDNEAEHFDPDDAEQCKRVVAYLLELASSASLMRVVWGMAVLLDPANKMVDPDADTLEHHPDTVAALAALAAPRSMTDEEHEVCRAAVFDSCEIVAAPLSDAEIQKIWDVAAGAIPGWSRHIAYARAIEAALKARKP